MAQQRAYNANQKAALRAAKPVAPEQRPAQRASAVPPLADRMYRPEAADVAELRRQQAEFKKTTRAISRENSWMAVPALAPAGVVLGLGAIEMAAARLAPVAVRQAPFQFVQRDPYLRVGDNYSTRGGRQAHAALRERVAQKPGWKPEPTVPLGDGRIVRPDVRTPARVRKAGQEPEPFQMELKPNTPSGRRAAQRAVKKYKDTGVKTRPIYYDPKSFL